MEDIRIPRQWLVIAPRGAGKSTLAAQMSPEHLVLDLDGRWVEQHKTAAGKSHIIKESEPLKIVKELETMKPQLAPYINTIIVDSGTAVMDFMQSKGRLMEVAAKQEGKKFNLNDLHKMKADTMRLLRFAVLQWHCDYMWIFHTEESMESGKKQIRTTISSTELERMKANLNAVMTIVQDPKGKRGVRIEWSRFNNNIAANQVIWDEQGLFRGIPEKLDIFLQNFSGSEGFNGNSYSGEWLLKFLGTKGVKFTDQHEMFMKLDIKDEPLFFDRNGWGKLIEKATTK
jgi:hypothetical protein